MNTHGCYQEFDRLTPEEFAALEHDILERGVQVPIVFDESGNVLDGHHRLAICQKHGITDYPREVKRGLSEEEKRDLAQSLNMARRSLTRKQRQHQIKNRLQRHPEHSDRKIAQALGVDHKTVGRLRKQLESAGEVPQVGCKVGLDGMPYKMPEKPKCVDAEGGEVPQHLEKAFNTRGEFTSLLNTITDVKRRSRELANWTTLRDKLKFLQRHLNAVEELLTESSPHVVHFSCEGEGCDVCHHLGYLTGGEIPQRDAADSGGMP